MKTTNVFNEICKSWLNDFNSIRLGTLDENTIGVCTRGEMMYCFELTKFPFDLKKLNANKNVSDWKFLLKNNRALTQFAKTNEMIILDNKVTCVKFTDNQFDVWLDAKFLKNFDETATICAIDSVSNVFVYENGRLAGIIAPMKIKDQF